jgi:very-short-patch-repair endonuclease
MSSIHNRKELKDVRNALRRHATSTEAVLWSCLSGSKLEGRKFRRQHSVGPFVLDFYCPSERLCIEIDGSSHDDPTSSMNDQGRDAYLKDLGIRTLRFDNKDVIDDAEGVCDMIRENFR